MALYGVSRRSVLRPQSYTSAFYLMAGPLPCIIIWSDAIPSKYVSNNSYVVDTEGKTAKIKSPIFILQYKLYLSNP